MRILAVEDDIDRLSHQINDALDKLESLMSRYSSSKF